MTGQGADCLSESGVVRLFTGALDGSTRGRLDGHLAQCDRCALLVGEVARDTGSTGPRSADCLRPPVLSPGMVIANRYHVRRLLGAGAMGEVHEVDDRLLGTVVALKTLNAKLAGDDGALARLKQEVAAARRVTHPNVCRIFDLGVDHGDPALGALVFLTMEYLSGVTLARFLRAHGHVSPDDALPLLLQLADALAAAHTAGIIHRDLKAENIMLVDQAGGGVRAVITDFGLAGFAIHEQEGPGRGSGFSGTLAYAAPERIAGGRATAASDVYSFGLLAVEMLTGRMPSVPGASAAREALAALPEPLARVLARATTSDPQARLATGAAVAAALRALAGHEGRRAFSARTPWTAAFMIAAASAAALIVWLVGAEHRPVAAPAAPAQVQAASALPAPAPLPAPTTPAAPPAARDEARPRVKRAGLRRSMAVAPVAAPPDDDLVRELRFGATAKPETTAADADTSDAELVDPFKRRRPAPGDSAP